MRGSGLRLWSWLVVVLLLGCERNIFEPQTYTILAASPLEALPFMLPKENTLQHYHWKVIIDGEGTLEERLARHEVDFYFVDFFQYYDMYDEESQFIHHQAILANLIDYRFIVRKSLQNSEQREWRIGFTSGTITDYLLDYWFEDAPIQRIQVRDEEQALELLQNGVLDGMVLRSAYVDPLNENNTFIELHSSMDDALYLNVLLPLNVIDDDQRAKIIHDYRIGLSSYQQDSSLLDRWVLSPNLRKEILTMNEIEPFLSPDIFEKMRIWRLIHVPFSPSWSYESLMWLPEDNVISN